MKVESGPSSADLKGGLLVALGRTAGIGGISMGILLLLFRQFLAQRFFPQLNSSQAYKLLLLFIEFTFGAAVAGLAVWASRITKGRLLAIILLMFAVAMGGLGVYTVRSEADEIKTNGSQTTATSVISGLVVDARTNLSIDNAVVEAVADTGGPTKTTRTDDAGNFRLEFRSPGVVHVRISATAPHYALSVQVVQVPVDGLIFRLKQGTK